MKGQEEGEIPRRMREGTGVVGLPPWWPSIEVHSHCQAVAQKKGPRKTITRSPLSSRLSLFIYHLSLPIWKPEGNAEFGMFLF